MISELLQKIDPNLPTAQKRKLHAEIITQNPDAFHLCENCESISLTDESICPVCESYHFLTDINLIITAAKNLGERLKTLLTREDLEN